MRFKCEHRRQVNPLDSSPRTHTTSLEGQPRPLFPTISYGYMPGTFERAAAGNLYSAYPHLLSNSRFQPQIRVPVCDSVNGNKLPSPASSTSSVISLTNGRQSPPHDKQEVKSRSSPEKRPMDDREDSLVPSPKRLASNEGHRISPHRRSISPEANRTISHSPLSLTTKNDYNGLRKLDHNQNLHNSSDEEDTISAFRKVEKHSRRPSLSPPSSIPSHPSVSSQAFLISNQSPSIFSPTPKRELQGGFSPPSMLPRYPIITGTGLVPPLLPGGNYNENMPMNIADIYRNTLKMGELMRPDKLADIHNIENINMLAKMPFLTDNRMMQPQMTPAMAANYYKSQNPMVEKLLTTPLATSASNLATSLSMAQNWCAKCNATFRMTSDLVYHMRSHHMQAGDPLKKKREDKLKCNICSETFKERHHLTRHMTSHA